MIGVAGIEFGDRNRRNRCHLSHADTNTYPEDTHRKALRRGFLGGGSIPSGLEEDDPAATIVATTVTDRHDKTYRIPNR
jgi:hypothetical protein